MKLGVNLDHVATIRQARYRNFRAMASRAEPDLLEAARAAERGGADGITLHLREDRRHIQDADVWMIRRRCRLPLNLEMALDPEILRIALRVSPDEVCMVPEKRQEVTTEGGLDVIRSGARLRKAIDALHRRKILVSLFIAANAGQIRAAAGSGAEFIELHTGSYAEAKVGRARARELKRLKTGSDLAHALGLRVNAGHGINYQNIGPVLKLPYVETLNIGHTIVSRAIMVGIEQAVREMAKKIHAV